MAGRFWYFFMYTYAIDSFLNPFNGGISIIGVDLLLCAIEFHVFGVDFSLCAMIFRVFCSDLLVAEFHFTCMMRFHIFLSVYIILCDLL